MQWCTRCVCARVDFSWRTDWRAGLAVWHTQPAKQSRYRSPPLQNCSTLCESTTRAPRTDPDARTHTLAPKQHLESGSQPRLVLTAFLYSPGTSGSDLALTKPPSQIGLSPSLLDLSTRAEQKPSALCPQLNRRKFQFACNSPLKRSTLRCRSSSTCGFLQVSDPPTPSQVLWPLPPSHHPIPPPPTPLLLWERLLVFISQYCN